MSKQLHDSYVARLAAYLEPFYDFVSTHIQFKRDGRDIGEADVVARTDAYTHVFEVKCSPRIAKAKCQAKQLRRVFDDSTKFFFYCGATKTLKRLEV